MHKGEKMESKILHDFFEKQHRKFKERAHSILHGSLGHHFSPTESVEWRQLRDEADAVTSHPLGVAPPASGNSRSGNR